MPRVNVKEEALLAKTELCSFYANGACKRGAKCSFAHGHEELVTKPNLAKTSICEKWARGKCRKSNCRYAHGSKELQEAMEHLAQIPATEVASTRTTDSFEASLSCVRGLSQIHEQEAGNSLGRDLLEAKIDEGLHTWIQFQMQMEPLSEFKEAGLPVKILMLGSDCNTVGVSLARSVDEQQHLLPWRCPQDQVGW
eukprot:TRINITY_DN80144_c0_g1_i1.p1 TRINITY_DN80144_c0_g1~~TRINITY_DN80144_c0_g1_i1.p1  ORF type:complete len:208 (-),score=43.16 TRINITY_DN80144_c0_g1_i1:104-691(-)